jgi:Voltage-dependent anion channel
VLDQYGRRGDLRARQELLQLLPFLKGLTLLFWATATWWIPMLVILGVWRHGIKRFPFRYDPLYRGAVFPLGLYTACTWRLAQAIDVPSLAAIPRMFIFVALAAWTLTFAGLVGARPAAIGALSLPAVRTLASRSKADVILVTHSHGDHMDRNAIKMVSTPTTTRGIRDSSATSSGVNVEEMLSADPA